MISVAIVRCNGCVAASRPRSKRRANRPRQSAARRSRCCDADATFPPQSGRSVATWQSRHEAQAMLYVYSAKTLRAMLVDARQALALVDDNEALVVQEMIDAIIHELSTRKD